jgi:tetratricopeptide (TPR) repeat protein
MHLQRHNPESFRDKSTAEIFNEKVSLIYEYNKKSPLFVRMANMEMENNNVDQSVFILEEGIKEYPHYAAAYLLLGKAYILTGNYSVALKYIKKGSDLIHSKKTYEYYLKELESIKKQRSLFQGNSRSIFLPESDLPESSNELKSSVIGNEENIHGPAYSIDDNLAKIAREISNIPGRNISPDSVNQNLKNVNIPANLTKDEESGSNLIISETLAKIYTAQGEFTEAIDVYKKLIKKNPHKEEYYNQKINELKSEL